ncbi:winged helix-turn-helix transcriptional regulator [Actinophytocola sediminis]
MHRYEQHCPIARAAEVLTEPWTLLVVRELLRGSTRRADLARGLPKMSASLLRSRLRVLEHHGVITHDAGERGERSYRLTSAGHELRPIVEHLGQWGRRWLDRPRIGDLDPELLVFDICREIDSARLPVDPLTVEVDFADAPQPRRWWLSLSAAGVLADQNVQPDAAVRVSCTLGALAGVWLGHVSWLQAVRERIIMLTGDRAAVRVLIDCLGVSRYAPGPVMDGTSRT